MIATIASYRRQIAEHPERYRLVQDARDLRRDARLAVAFDVEGALSIGDRLDLVDLYYDLGVRWTAFVYNRANLAGAGCHDDVDEGLTPFGGRLVARMEDAGMIKCCSHTGYRTALEIFAAARKPTILSHSNPRALADHERNVPDALLRACAQTGGVVGINAVGLFLGTADPSARDVFRHLDYVVHLIGPEHVGIAFDSVFPAAPGASGFEPESRPDYWPPSRGYSRSVTILGPEILHDVVACMREAGYSRSAIDGILGGNFARVAAACWKSGAASA